MCGELERTAFVFSLFFLADSWTLVVLSTVVIFIRLVSTICIYLRQWVRYHEQREPRLRFGVKALNALLLFSFTLSFLAVDALDRSVGNRGHSTC